MAMMVFACLGSNVDRERHIRNAIQSLKNVFGHLLISPVYENEAFGFKGDPFFNLAVGFETDRSIADIQAIFTKIENENGRDRTKPRFSARTLDIDLLLYGDLVLNEDKLKLPRPEIYQQAYVLKPLSDIAGHRIDPIHNIDYASLWREFKGNRQGLVRVALESID